MNATAPTARLKTRYLEEIRPALVGRFGYSSVMQAPKLEKITVNMGVGQAKTDSKVLKAAVEQLATIAGQQPSVRRARKSVAAFKLREGNPVGVAVTLRSERGYEFLDRLVSIAIPRIRDFRGLNPRSFDGRGNYSLGVREQIIFPEIDYDAIDEVRGLDITITTTAASDVEAYALLSAMGMPFAAQGRPAGFDEPGQETAEGDSAQPEDAAPAESEQPAASVTTAPVQGDDAAESDIAAGAETKDAVETAPPAETEDAAETAAPVEPDQAVEIAAPSETEDAAETAAPVESEDAVEQPKDAPAPEPEAVAETAAPAEAADATKKPKAAKAAKAAKPAKPAKPKRKAKPKAKAAEASADEQNGTRDSADGDTAEKESTD
jgi:large subunit ribosomal protein L5